MPLTPNKSKKKAAPRKSKTPAPHVPYAMENCHPLTKAFYVEMVLNGVSTRLAEMLALRQPPKIMTDDVMLAGMPTLANMPADARNAIVQRARQFGYNPKDSDVYLDSVASTPGDPMAFVNHGQGRGHVKKVLEYRGQASEGMVNTKYREPEEEVRGEKLSKKIANRIYRNMVRENPDIARKEVREVMGSIVDKHGGTGKIDD